MTEHDKRILSPKTHPSKDEDTYRAWSAQRTFCYACGHKGDWLPLETHHIVKAGRAHEPCNLIRLCHRDHCLAEGLDVRDERGELLPKLTIGMCLSLKSIQDPEEYDAARLEQLRGSRLPEPEAVPEYFMRQYAKRRAA